MIPRLVSIRPRDNKEKEKLVREFIKHYDSVRSDMSEIEALMASGGSVDADFFGTICEHANALRHNLRQKEKWHNILPCTPLQRKNLLKLRDLIKCNGKYFLLSDLVHHLDEIADWLRLPPPPRDHSTGVMEEFMKANVTASKPNIGVPVQRQPSIQAQYAKIVGKAFGMSFLL